MELTNPMSFQTQIQALIAVLAHCIIGKRSGKYLPNVDTVQRKD